MDLNSKPESEKISLEFPTQSEHGRQDGRDAAKQLGQDGKTGFVILSCICAKQTRYEGGINFLHLLKGKWISIFSTMLIYSLKLTFNPRRIWYMRNCTWSSVSFWHLTMLLRSAPIRWVTRYLPNRKDGHHSTQTQMSEGMPVSLFIKKIIMYLHFQTHFSRAVSSLCLISHMAMWA